MRLESPVHGKRDSWKICLFSSPDFIFLRSSTYTHLWASVWSRAWASLCISLTSSLEERGAHCLHAIAPFRKTLTFDYFRVDSPRILSEVSVPNQTAHPEALRPLSKIPDPSAPRQSGHQPSLVLTICITRGKALERVLFCPETRTQQKPQECDSGLLRLRFPAVGHSLGPETWEKPQKPALLSFSLCLPPSSWTKGKKSCGAKFRLCLPDSPSNSLTEGALCPVGKVAGWLEAGWTGESDRSALAEHTTTRGATEPSEVLIPTLKDVKGCSGPVSVRFIYLGLGSKSTETLWLALVVRWVIWQSWVWIPDVLMTWSNNLTKAHALLKVIVRIADLKSLWRNVVFCFQKCKSWSRMNKEDTRDGA